MVPRDKRAFYGACIDEEYLALAAHGNSWALATAFLWGATAEGFAYWDRQYHGHSRVDVRRLRAMLIEYRESKRSWVDRLRRRVGRIDWRAYGGTLVHYALRVTAVLLACVAFTGAFVVTYLHALPYWWVYAFVGCVGAGVLLGWFCDRTKRESALIRENTALYAQVASTRVNYGLAINALATFRDLSVYVESLRDAANEVDCGRDCRFLVSEHDTNAVDCTSRSTCRAFVASDLRELADACEMAGRS